MNPPNRERKNEIKAINAIQLNDEQKEASRLIHENQIVIITGRAGTGKSLVCANVALKLIKTKQAKKIFTTRPAVEVGRTLGFLKGDLKEKFDPYTEALIENLKKCCTNPKEIDEMIEKESIVPMPVQFVRSKTIDEFLIVEEAQNLTKAEMLAILTRLGKTGKIIINGDPEQQDTNESYTGLQFAIDISNRIDGIEYIKLKENHRSDLVGKILEFTYGK